MRKVILAVLLVIVLAVTGVMVYRYVNREMSDMQSKNERISGRLLIAENENTELQQQYKEAEALTEKLSGEISALQEENDRLTSEIESVTAQLQEAEALVAQLSAQAESDRPADETGTTVVSDVPEASGENETDNANEQALAAANELVASLQNEKNELENKIEQVNAELNEKIMLVEKNAAKIEELEKENAALKKTNTQLISESYILKDENAQLLADYNEASASLTAADGRIEALEIENAVLVESNSNEESTAIKQIMEQVDLLKSETASLNSEVKKKDQKITELTGENERLNGILAENAQELDALSVENAILTGKNTELEANIVAKATETDEKDALIAAQKTEIEDKDAQILEINEVNIALLATIDANNAAIGKAYTEIDGLKQELETLRADSSKLSEDNGVLSQGRAELEAKIEEQNTEIERLTTAYEALRASISMNDADYINAYESGIKVDYENAVNTSLKIGDKIKLGRYEQDGNENNGSESIGWVVIGENENAWILLSNNVLDVYNAEADFAVDAFNETELMYIIPGDDGSGYLRLPEAADIASRFTDPYDRIAFGTEYALLRGVVVSDDGAVNWPITDEGRTGCVNMNGEITFAEETAGFGFRPVVYLSKNIGWVE